MDKIIRIQGIDIDTSGLTQEVLFKAAHMALVYAGEARDRGDTIAEAGWAEDLRRIKILLYGPR